MAVNILPPILIRGGGDLASGVALRLFRAGLRPIITELPQPLVVRRLVSFAEAIYEGRFWVEDTLAQRVETLDEALQVCQADTVPVLPDPLGQAIAGLAGRSTASPFRLVVIDGRMRKAPPEPTDLSTIFLLGLGPGFRAPGNCHAVIETNRGHRLGRVIWQGETEADTGIPEEVGGRNAERVLRAPASGVLHARAEIGQRLAAGQPAAEVDGHIVSAPFAGVLRGMLRSGLHVEPGLKIGDVDPRDDPRYCRLVSDKALAVGGAALEAILPLLLTCDKAD